VVNKGFHNRTSGGRSVAPFTPISQYNSNPLKSLSSGILPVESLCGVTDYNVAFHVKHVYVDILTMGGFLME